MGKNKSIRPDIRTIVSTVGEGVKGIGTIVMGAQMYDLAFNIVTELGKLITQPPLENSTDFSFIANNETNCPPDELLQISNQAWMVAGGVGTILTIGAVVSHYGFNLYHQHSSQHSHGHTGTDHCHTHSHYGSRDSHVDMDGHTSDEQEAMSINLGITDEKAPSTLSLKQKAALLLCATTHAGEAGGSVVLGAKVIATLAKSSFTLWGEAALTAGAMLVGGVVAWGDYRPCQDSMEKLNEEEKRLNTRTLLRME